MSYLQHIEEREKKREAELNLLKLVPKMLEVLRDLVLWNSEWLTPQTKNLGQICEDAEKLIEKVEESSNGHD